MSSLLLKDFLTCFPLMHDSQRKLSLNDLDNIPLTRLYFWSFESDLKL